MFVILQKKFLCLVYTDSSSPSNIILQVIHINVAAGVMVREHNSA